MALKTLPSDTTTYQDMTEALLPRGPIWRSGAVRGMANGLAAEAVRLHNRLVDLMLEAYPSTALELLAEWEIEFGLPLCSDAPTTTADRQAALAGRVAAKGGQDVHYYTALIRAVLGDPEAVVTIVENPYGTPLYAWVGSAWDLLGSRSGRFHWRVELPSSATTAQRHIVECLLQLFKPAHTVLSMLPTACAGGGPAASLTLSDSPSYDFGTMAVGTSAQHTFTATNVGAGDATGIIGVVLSGPFRFTGGLFPGIAGDLPDSLAPGSNGTFEVSFSPPSVGAFSGFVGIEYCDGTDRVFVTRQLFGAGS